MKKRANFSAYLPPLIQKKINELRDMKPHLSSNTAVVIDCIMLIHALETEQKRLENKQ